MTFEEYARHFATVTDARLVATIDHPEDVEPLAVEAAKAEVMLRCISAEHMTAVRSSIAEKRTQHDVSGRMARTFVSEAKGVFLDVAQVTGKRWRTWLALVLLGPLIASLPVLSELPKYLSMPGYMHGGLLEDYLPVVLLPATMWWLWRTLARGWYAGAIYACYKVLGAWVTFGSALKNDLFGYLLRLPVQTVSASGGDVPRVFVDWITTMLSTRATLQVSVDLMPADSLFNFYASPNYATMLLTLFWTGGLLWLFMLQRSMLEFDLPYMAKLRAIIGGAGLFLSLKAATLFW